MTIGGGGDGGGSSTRRESSSQAGLASRSASQAGPPAVAPRHYSKHGCSRQRRPAAGSKSRCRAAAPRLSLANHAAGCFVVPKQARAGTERESRRNLEFTSVSRRCRSLCLLACRCRHGQRLSQSPPVSSTSEYLLEQLAALGARIASQLREARLRAFLSRRLGCAGALSRVSMNVSCLQSRLGLPPTLPAAVAPPLLCLTANHGRPRALSLHPGQPCIPISCSLHINRQARRTDKIEQSQGELEGRGSGGAGRGTEHAASHSERKHTRGQDVQGTGKQGIASGQTHRGGNCAAEHITRAYVRRLP